jgi:hypothetical protein
MEIVTGIGAVIAYVYAAYRAFGWLDLNGRMEGIEGQVWIFAILIGFVAVINAVTGGPNGGGSPYGDECWDTRGSYDC